MIEVLDRIPLELDVDNVMKWLQMGERDASIRTVVEEVIDLARPVARPKAVVAISPVEKGEGDFVEIDGVRFTSRILRINLDEPNRVFPYVATCGRELDEVSVPEDDLLRAFCLDLIKTLALGAAMGHLTKYLTQRYALGKMSHMNPGSLEDWPIEQQKELFSLLGDVEGAIGVQLNDWMTMVPHKSTSGIYFPTESEFENCKLCPMQKCMGRRAPYDAELARKYRETSV